MKRLTILLGLYGCLIPTANEALAQAYPDSSASWCAMDLGNSTCFDVQFIMEANPDTVILGQTYKRINAYTAPFCWGIDWEIRRRYYVRSDTLGKGYVMLLDSMQEYLTIDNAAQAGDTVQNVLVDGTWYSAFPYYSMQSVVVDSVAILTNNGVSVTRQYIHVLNYSFGDPGGAYMVFWQQGIGGSYGPLTYLNAASGFSELRCLRDQDTYVYSEYTMPHGLPGVACDCPLSVATGVEEMQAHSSVTVKPNPSTGLFHLNQPAEAIRVFNPMGQLLYRSQGSSINLEAWPEGVYTAVIQTAKGKFTQRLVVLR